MAETPRILPEAAGRIAAALSAAELGPVSLPEIEGYRLVERVGAGGGGEVYRGFREGSENPIAIKVLRHARSGARQGRAWRELEILSQLRLPSLPRVFDYGLSGGQLFIVTEFVEGQPLDRYTSVLPLRERVEVLARVADAVQSLHEHGILHRDIKPSNVLIDASGHPVVIDLGIATLLASDVFETLTQDGEPIGTPAFMAPEQARGERERISTRTDIYGLGATAYALLTGTTPHDTRTTLHEAVRRVAQDAPRDPRWLAPEFPRPLAAVLSKAVSQRPEQRYSSAASFAADLRRWLRGEPVVASPGSPIARASRWAVTHPALGVAALGFLITLGTLAGIALGWWFLNLRPQTMTIDARERQWVRLQSASGRTLYEWDTGAENGIHDALLVEPEGGGGKVALVAFGPEADPRGEIPADYIGMLCAFDAANPGRLLWKSVIGTPRRLRYAIPSQETADRYRPRKLRLMEVFAESPGKEILLVSACRPYSPCVVQLYRADGTLLYEVWHDGYIDDVHWLHDAGVLVMSGVDSDGTWVQRGYPQLTGTYPQVLFAVRPAVGQRGLVVGSNVKRGTDEALWYRAVLPPAHSDVFDPRVRLSYPPPGVDAGRFVQVGLTVRRAVTLDGASLTLVLDETGRIRDRVIASRWESIPGLPDPLDVYLDIPPPRMDLGADTVSPAAD